LEEFSLPTQKKNIIGKRTELNMPYDWAPNLNEENLPRAWP